MKDILKDVVVRAQLAVLHFPTRFVYRRALRKAVGRVNQKIKEGGRGCELCETSKILADHLMHSGKGYTRQQAEEAAEWLVADANKRGWNRGIL